MKMARRQPRMSMWAIECLARWPETLRMRRSYNRHLLYRVSYKAELDLAVLDLLMPRRLAPTQAKVMRLPGISGRRRLRSSHLRLRLSHDSLNNKYLRTTESAGWTGGASSCIYKGMFGLELREGLVNVPSLQRRFGVSW